VQTYTAISNASAKIYFSEKRALHILKIPLSGTKLGDFPNMGKNVI